MKVIIVEVTRAANSFGREHLETIRKAYGLIADIVEQARHDGSFKSDISAEFAAMCFYGAIEQLLSAGSSGSSRRPRRSSSVPRRWSSRRSAAGSNRGRAAVSG